MNRKLRWAEQGKIGSFGPTAQPGRSQAETTSSRDSLASLFAEAVRCCNAGRLAEAVALYDRMLCLDSDLTEVHCNRGIALAKMGRLGDAELAYRSAIARNPNSADAYNNLGSTLCLIGKTDDAERAIQAAISLRPDWPLCHLNLGIALHLLGRLDEAEAAYRRAIALDPNFAEAHNNLGELLRYQGRLDDAERSLRSAIALYPRYADAYGNLGNTLRDRNNPSAAEAAYRQAIALNPRSIQAHNNLGSILLDQGRPDEAEQALRRAIALCPRYAEAHANLGNALIALNRPVEAEAAYRRAIALKPSFAEAYNNLGVVLKYLGRMADARRAVEQALQLSPQNAFYFLSLSDLKRFEAGDAHLKAMEDLAVNSDALSATQKIHLHFALAKAYEDTGRCDDAFDQRLAGNALKRRSIVYDETAGLTAFDRIREVFTADLIRKYQNAGEPSSAPVFIIGMPRSGSTLIEQILASHPQISGGGELSQFDNAVTSMAKSYGCGFPDAMAHLRREDLRELGARYVAEIMPLAPAASHIVNKNLLNFLHAGLIHLALPRARIIHAVRDPADTCMSCFSMLFAYGHPYSYDLAELGRYYRRYRMLMDHWRDVLPPGRILDVRYEDVVADLEGQARRMIAHCGLTFDARCLAFHTTERPVLTASSVQVRQRLYRDGLGRWKKYVRQLAPLLAELS